MLYLIFKSIYLRILQLWLDTLQPLPPHILFFENNVNIDFVIFLYVKQYIQRGRNSSSKQVISILFVRIYIACREPKKTSCISKLNKKSPKGERKKNRSTFRKKLRFPTSRHNCDGKHSKKKNLPSPRKWTKSGNQNTI